MEIYESKQQQIRLGSAQIYTLLSSFNNFTPMVQDKVEDWQATEDSCSFKMKGFNAGLQMADKEPYKYIKITGEGVPFLFEFWIQFNEVAPDDTRIRLVLHAELNMMMKMMIGKKIQGGLDQMVEAIAQGINNQVPD